MKPSTSLMIGMAPSLIRRVSSSAVPVFALPWRMAAYMRSSSGCIKIADLSARLRTATLRHRPRLPDSIFEELGGYDFAIPRRDAPESLHEPPSRREGAGNAGCPLHPQPLMRRRGFGSATGVFRKI